MMERYGIQYHTVRYVPVVEKDEGLGSGGTALNFLGGLCLDG